MREFRGRGCNSPSSLTKTMIPSVGMLIASIHPPTALVAAILYGLVMLRR